MPHIRLAKRPSNRLLAVLLIVISLFAMVPGAISYGIQYWLKQQGLTDSYLLDVSFNPFAGRLTLKNLDARKAGTPPLALRLGQINIDWLPLTRRQALVKTLRLEGLSLTLIQEGDKLSLNGIPLAGGTTDEKPEAEGPIWGFGVDRLELRDARIGFQLPDFKQTLEIENITLENLHSWEVEQPARLNLRIHLGDALIALDLDVRSFSVTRTVDGRLQIQGLDLAALAADLHSLLPPELQVARASLDMDANIQLHLKNNHVDYKQEGSVKLSKGDMAYAEHRVQLQRLDWQGRLGWTKETGPAARGKLTLSGANVSMPERELLLARLDSLQIPGLALMSNQQIELDGLTLDKPVALAALAEDAKSAPLFSATRVTLGKSRLDGSQGVDLGELAVQDAQLQLTLNESKQAVPLNRLQDADKTPQPAAEPPAQPADTTAPMHLRLAGLTLQGNSQLSFLDKSTTPPFSRTLTLEQFTVGTLDNRSEQPTPFTLKGRFGEYSSIDLAGDARPLADKLNLALKGDVKAVELPPLSSYTAGALGYNLQSGQLDAKLDVKIVEDQLDTETELTLNKLTVKQADPDKYGQMAKELAMPLDSALNMLRDSDDNIRLKLPIKGDIHAPEFDLSQVINKAIGKALKSAAIGSIKLALQPYGMLITLAQKAGEQSQQALLKPIEFQANRTILSAENLDYLGKLAQLLADRPKMRVSVCGLAVEADRAARSAAAEAARQKQQPKQGQTAPTDKAPQLPPITIPDEELLQLAKDRADIVKRQLVNMGAEPGRLFICNPELDTKVEAIPRVDLRL